MTRAAAFARLPVGLAGDASGNIGIGTGTPTGRLHVAGAGTQAFTLERTDATTAGLFQLLSGNITNVISASTAKPIAFEINGTERLRIDGTGNVVIGGNIDSAGRLLSVAGASQVAFLSSGGGSATYPAFGFAGQVGSNSGRGAGMYLPGDGVLAYSTWGAERMRIDGAGNIGIGAVADAGNTLRFFDVQNTNTGASAGAIIRLITNNAAASGATTVDIVKYRTSGFIIANNDSASSNYTAFAIGGSERVRIDNTGNLMVGASSGGGRLYVKTADTSSGSWGMKVDNSAGTILFAVLNNGQFYTGNGTYNLTTAAAANCVIGGDNGILSRSTSSIKYKTDVENATHGLAEVLALRPVTYKGKNDGDKVFGGLIAEEVHDAGLTEFVQYAEDGTPDALAYSNMVSLAFKAIQEQQAIIEGMAAKLKSAGVAGF